MPVMVMVMLVIVVLTTFQVMERIFKEKVEMAVMMVMVLVTVTVMSVLTSSHVMERIFKENVEMAVMTKAESKMANMVSTWKSQSWMKLSKWC